MSLGLGPRELVPQDAGLRYRCKCMLNIKSWVDGRAHDGDGWRSCDATGERGQAGGPLLLCSIASLMRDLSG
jgi:hypothetical protein